MKRLKANRAKVKSIKEPLARIRTWTLADAVRQRSFWMFCLAFFLNPIATFAIMLHQVALIVGRGFEPMYVASAFGVLGIFSVMGRFLSGTISDYIGREKAYTIFISCSVTGASLLFFLDSQHAWILPFYVVFTGLGMGIGGTLFSAMIADVFPGPNMGRILGRCAFFSGLGAAFGPWLLGYLYDVFGNYTPGIWCILAALVGAVAATWIAAPRKAKAISGK